MPCAAHGSRTSGSWAVWIVDSSVWIDYFNGTATPETDRLDAVLGQRELGLGDIVLCEVLQGFRNDRNFECARDALLRFPIFTIGGQELAVKSAMVTVPSRSRTRIPTTPAGATICPPPAPLRPVRCARRT